MNERGKEGGRGERELESQGGAKRGKRQRSIAFYHQVTDDKVRRGLSLVKLAEAAH